MEITWLGHSCFRIKGREAVLVTDPYDGSLGYPTNKIAADIVTLSHEHPGHSYLEDLEGQPKVVRGPGEYELAGVFITGLRTFHDGEKGKARGNNTVYIIEMDEIKLCHLGDLGHVPSEGQIEEMSEVDILFIPVGGVSTIDAPVAVEFIGLLEPKVVVPMHFKTEAVTKELDPLDRFLKEMGSPGAAPQPKVTFTKSSLPEELQVTVLDYPH